MFLFTIFFISLLVLPFAWKCLKKSILDSSRDSMFDLREKVRYDFLKNGWNLNSAEYKNIRDLINYAIRYAEDKTLSEVLQTNKLIEGNKKVLNSVGEFKKKILYSENKDIRDYLNKTYEDLSDIVLLYLFSTNKKFLSIIFIICIFALALKPIIDIKRKPKTGQMEDFLSNASASEYFANSLT